MVCPGPSPKRRKTANGPLVLTAEDIAQSNSTAQLFAGQRINRWMIHTAPNEEIVKQPQHPHRTSNTSRSTSGTMAMQARENTVRLQKNANQAQGGISTIPAVAPPITGSPAGVSHTGIDTASARPHAPLVDYEFPTTTTHSLARASPMSAFPPPQTADQITRAASTAPNRGLPSPVSSDGNMNSPAMQYPLQTQVATPPPHIVAGRGPPMRQYSLPSGYSTPYGRGHPLPPAQSQRTSSRPHYQQTMASPIVPSNSGVRSAGHPSQYPAASYYPPSNMHLNVMLAKLDAFRDSVQGLNPIDTGRIALLRDAINKEDWFYIVLSQLHALSATPSQLPTSAKTLPPAAFQTLDILLSMNQGVTPMVLQWLGNFPASIVDLYSSADNARYNAEVQLVARFLRSFPRQWELLRAHCRELEAPPLVEDMWDCLGLASRVLQTTIFRTLARIIWSGGIGHSSGQGVEALERLHAHNQAMFYSNRRRNKQQMDAAYQAFKFALVSWRKYQKELSQNSANGGNLHSSRPSQPVLFVLPENVEMTFRSAPSLPVLGNGQRPSAGPTRATIASPAHPSLISPNPSTTRQSQIVQQTSGQASSPVQNVQLQPQAPRATTGMPRLVPFLFPVPVQQRRPDPRVLVFPHETETQPRAQPTEPDTTRTALHQAHLRSPVLQVAQVNGVKPKLYRYVLSNAVPPIRINEKQPINTIPFEIDFGALQRIPKPQPSAIPGGRSSCLVDRTSQTYRLRCVSVPLTGLSTQKAWVEADTIWPEKLYFDLNGKDLEPRRKLHHGRYLPIDLTPYIKGGQNILQVFVNRESKDQTPFNYAIGVETVGVMTHDDILASVTHLSAADSMSAITASLSTSNTDGPDDDIVVTSSNTIINVFDPFYGGRMVRTPVRGSGCIHRDCFDLETFLSTRKSETSDAPTEVDCWRCPICRGDIRPPTLVIDEFLLKVRKELEVKGLSETKAIVVDADGSWKAKEEERTGVRSASLEREERGESALKQVEIIELD